MASTIPPDDSQASTVLAVQWVTGSLAVILTLLRVYIRGFVRHNLGWDDYMIWIATGLAIFASVFETLNVHYGVGRHSIYVMATVQDSQRVNLILALENGLATTFVKLSVCFFILRMIGRTQKPVRYMIYVNLAILLPFTVAVTIVQGVACVPFSKLWTPRKPGKCLDKEAVRAVAQAYSGVGVVPDFITAATPLGIVYKLQRPWSRKLNLAFLLVLGFVTAGCSIAKTVTLVYFSEDPTWDQVPVIIWAALEHQLGIVVANLPTIQPALNYVEVKISSVLTQIRSSMRKTIGRGSAFTRRGYNTTENERDKSEDAIHLKDMSIRKTTDINVEADVPVQNASESTSFV